MRCVFNSSDAAERREEAKSARIAALRRTLENLQGVPSCLDPGCASANTDGSSLGTGLPGPGLACGVLHEIVAGYADRPAGFGFLFTLVAAALAVRIGPAMFVAPRRALAEFGNPCGHGLAQLGLDPGRLMLVETQTEKDALWALEEVLRSSTRPAMVTGALQTRLGLTPSRRLNLAAAVHATPLVLLCGPSAAGTSAAATRWRVAAAPAARDRFGSYTHPRWQVALARCRNGRPGAWLIEWNHVAHRFRVVEGLADRPPAADAGLRLAG
jgi:protein ImuA